MKGIVRFIGTIIILFSVFLFSFQTAGWSFMGLIIGGLMISATCKDHSNDKEFENWE